MVGEWERGKSRIKNVEGKQFESIDLRLVVTLDPIVYPIPSKRTAKILRPIIWIAVESNNAINSTTLNWNNCAFETLKLWSRGPAGPFL